MEPVVPVQLLEKLTVGLARPPPLIAVLAVKLQPGFITVINLVTLYKVLGGGTD